MEDNEMVQALVTGILESVNASRLPLAVKALALENILLRVQAAMTTASKNNEKPQKTPAE